MSRAQDTTSPVYDEIRLGVSMILGSKPILNLNQELRVWCAVNVWQRVEREMGFTGQNYWVDPSTEDEWGVNGHLDPNEVLLVGDGWQDHFYVCTVTVFMIAEGTYDMGWCSMTLHKNRYKHGAVLRRLDHIQKALNWRKGN